MDPDTQTFLLIERNVHGVVSAYKQVCDEQTNKKRKQTNHRGHISNNSSMSLLPPEDLPVKQEVQEEEGDIDDPDPVQA